MQIRYTTQSGSVYVRANAGDGEIWYKLDKNDLHVPLAGAMHISRRRLQSLITDYPRAALDQTACFGEGLAKEFFDDAKREGAVEVPEGEESTIFFLVNRGLSEYGIGYSSRIVEIELDLDADNAQTATKAS
ncbi:MAG: hypothetical protein ACYSUT_05605 [Planctomycetota bacterium]|jgi:hypothetical protein